MALGPITVSGKLLDGGGMYHFEGCLRGAYLAVCDWCGETVEAPFEILVEWIFVEPRPGEEIEESDEYATRDDGVAVSMHALHDAAIDLARPAWEDIVLGLPTRFPEGYCDCQHVDAAERPYESGSVEQTNQQSNKGFAKLADMFPDLKPESKE